MGQNPVVRRLAGAGLTVSQVVAGASACGADDGKGDRAGAAAAGSAASAKQSAADAKAMADSAMATAQLMVAREARDKAFLTVGRVSFGAAGLRELVAPAEARTAEGIGAGSTVEALKQAYGDKGLALAKNGKYQFAADADGPGWQLEFTVDGDKVSGVALVNRTVKCV
ncbi:hypothetical protein [Kitasatospora purpeofusca]|uniref:hypothetical protein n=1 Tax=Kitasatospora purpeofusca TaxID=67352 RepID=UPI0036573623